MRRNRPLKCEGVMVYSASVIRFNPCRCFNRSVAASLHQYDDFSIWKKHDMASVRWPLKTQNHFRTSLCVPPFQIRIPSRNYPVGMRVYTFRPKNSSIAKPRVWWRLASSSAASGLHRPSKRPAFSQSIIGIVLFSKC